MGAEYSGSHFNPGLGMAARLIIRAIELGYCDHRERRQAKASNNGKDVRIDAMVRGEIAFDGEDH